MAITKPTPTNTLAVRTQGFQLLTPLKPAVDKLTITSATGYLDGDELLGRIRNARAKWAQLMEPISGPNERALKELKEQAKAIKALDAEVDGPLGILEAQVKAEMRAFKLEEPRQLHAAEEEQRRESDRLRREAEEVARREQAAKTAPMRAKLAEKRVALETQAAHVEADPDVNLHPVRGGSSSSRRVRRVTITNLPAFLTALKPYEPRGGLYEFGHPPLSVVDVASLQSAVTAIYRSQPKLVETWPGVEIVDDIVIAGR